MRGFRVIGPEGVPGGVPGAVEKPAASLGPLRHNYEHAIWPQIVSTRAPSWDKAVHSLCEHCASATAVSGQLRQQSNWKRVCGTWRVRRELLPGAVFPRSILDSQATALPAISSSIARWPQPVFQGSNFPLIPLSSSHLSLLGEACPVGFRFTSRRYQGPHYAWDVSHSLVQQAVRLHICVQGSIASLFNYSIYPEVRACQFSCAY